MNTNPRVTPAEKRLVGWDARQAHDTALHWPFGHALGEPGNRAQQLTILHDAFALAQSAPRPGLVVELPYRWRRHLYAPIADWSVGSEAFSEAFKAAMSATATNGIEIQRLMPK
ncbi:MAG TPA: hypothetical protein VGN32_13335 [Ktedonobacterales bacterium]|nr:hypothetical protein [Ktedonobacterales bacterium]